MQSKKIILCPECNKNKPQTKQHIIPRRYGMTLGGRNKKLECDECQKFFDNTTIKEAVLMAQNNEVLESRRVSFNYQEYQIENLKHNLLKGETIILNTGSSIQAISAEAVNSPYTSMGSPFALNFNNSASEGEDKIEIKNNFNKDLIIYTSVIVDKSKNSF